jgi:hypothetical protein
MKLHLILLALLFSLSRAKFMAELEGHLTTGVQCTGEEFVDFKNCLPEEVNGSEWGAFMDPETDNNRNLNWCSGCAGKKHPRGTFCFTVCCNWRRLEETSPDDTPSLRRRVQEEQETSAVYTKGEWEGSGIALDYAKIIMGCLEVVSPLHPCVGNTEDMILSVSV